MFQSLTRVILVILFLFLTVMIFIPAILMARLEANEASTEYIIAFLHNAELIIKALLPIYYILCGATLLQTKVSASTTVSKDTGWFISGGKVSVNKLLSGLWLLTLILAVGLYTIIYLTTPFPYETSMVISLITAIISAWLTNAGVITIRQVIYKSSSITAIQEGLSKLKNPILNTQKKESEIKAKNNSSLVELLQ